MRRPSGLGFASPMLLPLRFDAVTPRIRESSTRGGWGDPHAAPTLCRPVGHTHPAGGWPESHAALGAVPAPTEFRDDSSRDASDALATREQPAPSPATSGAASGCFCSGERKHRPGQDCCWGTWQRCMAAHRPGPGGPGQEQQSEAVLGPLSDRSQIALARVRAHSTVWTRHRISARLTMAAGSLSASLSAATTLSRR
eukprot:174535-Chlamydomonas_euryale.AAC.1